MDAKGIARALRAQLKVLGHELTQGQALELVAKSAGWKDWNAIVAQDQPKALTSGKYCPKCGKQGTVIVGASAFIEQGPYTNDRYCFEGQADHYVCEACGGQFVDWSSAWPELREVSDLLCLLDRRDGHWIAWLYPIGHVLAELADSPGDQVPDKAAVIERARRENTAALVSGEAALEGPVRLVDELAAESRQSLFIPDGGAEPYEAILEMRRGLSKEDLDRVVGVPENALLF